MECYLDNSATTKPCQRALDAAAFAMTSAWGNPSSLHQKGIEAFTLLEKCRGVIAGSLRAQPSEIYFTPGGTAANNTAVFGAVQALRRRGNKIVTTAFEHPSVEACMDKLAAEGFEIIRLAPDAGGIVSASAFEKEIDENTILVSLMGVNNEIGTILPFDLIKKIIKEKHAPALLHVDHVQGYLKIPVFPKNSGIDLMSMSAHKVHGIKGAGALYVGKDVKLKPYILGGGQESGLCSGTQGLPAIAAFAAAVEDFGDTKRNLDKTAALKAEFIKRIMQLDGVSVNSPDSALPYIINLSLDKIPSQVAVNYFSMNGVCLSAGSACAKGHRSKALTAMRLPVAKIDTALRVSLSHNTTAQELAYCAGIMEKALQTLRKK